MVAVANIDEDGRLVVSLIYDMNMDGRDAGVVLGYGTAISTNF